MPVLVIWLVRHGASISEKVQLLACVASVYDKQLDLTLREYEWQPVPGQDLPHVAVARRSAMPPRYRALVRDESATTSTT